MKRHSKPSVARQTVSLYWQHAWRYKFLASMTLLWIPLAVVSFGFVPQFFISNILTKISTADFIKGDLWESFGPQLVIFAIVSLLGGIVAWRIAIIFLWSLEMRVQRDIYQRIFKHLLSQSTTFHADRFGGSLVSQSNKFANSYIRLADRVLFDIYTFAIALVVTLVVLWPKAPQVAVAILLTSFVFIVFATLFTRKVRDLRATEAVAENKQTGFLADAITNVLAVKSFAAEAYENKRFAKVTEEVRSATQRVMVSSMKREATFAFGTVTITILSLAAALAGVVYYDAEIGTVYLVIAFTAQITQRLWDYSNHTLKDINRALGDAEEMTKILAILPEIQDAKEPLESNIHRGDIVFQNVEFAHSGSKDKIFDKLSLHIKPGEKIGLVGPSGSGKSTFTKILLRFSDIQAGTIKIDGYDIAKITQRDLHAAISYVPQEPLLFHRSIKENIAYDNLDATQEEIDAVAKMANAQEFIADLPDGYKTLVGERGVKLSGGQRQRVAIARAMLKNSPILILDEATSALDSESEVLIQDALWKLMDGKTAIVIAHRLSTIQKMDRIIVLDKGAIVEQGSHKELITQNGVYAKLWAHQSGGFIED